MASSVQYHISQNQIAIDAVSEAPQPITQKWYFSRKEIECNTPSRSDGIDYKHEQHLRKMYCNYMQELGIELKVQSSAALFSNILDTAKVQYALYMFPSGCIEYETVATSCMFLACKAEETPRGLGELVVVAYKLIYKWDPSATRRIREIYDKQKDLIVTGERLLLTIIAFDLNIEHPYKSLIAALKELKITHEELAKVAWNFVNDWLRTSLCLQHKPHYIAAGSLFLAAKVKKVKLPTSKGNAWWMKFDVSPKRLEGDGLLAFHLPIFPIHLSHTLCLQAINFRLLKFLVVISDVIQQMMSLWEQSQSQTLTPKEQKVTESQTIKATTYSPQSTLSGHKVIQDSKTASKGDGEPRKSTMSNCEKINAFDNVHDTSTIDCHSSDNGNASNVGENSKILASMDQSSKMIASKDAGEPAKSSMSNSAKKQVFDNVHDTSRATIDCHNSVDGNASSVVEDSKILALIDQSSKTIASKDASEPAKPSTSNCAKLQAFDNVHDTSRATTDRHTSVNGNASSAVENSKIRASTDPCLAAKSVSFECDEKQAFDNVNGASQDIPICQTSDTGSAVSVVEDGDSGEPVTVKSDLSSSCNTVKLGGTAVSSQLDVNRIREKLKKRNSIKTMKRKRVEDTDDEIDGEAWIERELENGIVLDSSYPIEKLDSSERLNGNLYNMLAHGNKSSIGYEIVNSDTWLVEIKLQRLPLDHCKLSNQVISRNADFLSDFIREKAQVKSGTGDGKMGKRPKEVLVGRGGKVNAYL
ncbi:cyclin-T1-3-like protein isoform X1 [Tanacetum coccineum]|uniref:Cyclin-T1-3-like protein isoform X1 n=1 Tax=Tanacetum coccineum TaxID=301880 RepID=A0ABQ5GF12_9ASTR